MSVTIDERTTRGRAVAAAPPREHARTGRFAARLDDWRCGPVVYQVIVDRFAPSADLDAKRDHYPAPRTLEPWPSQPARGARLDEHGIWSHEVAFWGGDLASLRERLDHVAELGADVLYLNPIFDARSNHKYDATDYFAIAPEYGTRDDLRALAADLHARDMRLMLDGVFNHTGIANPWFRDALADPDAPTRSWYDFDERHPNGYRGWWNAANLPELVLENAEVRGRLWNDPDSVVRTYLADGADGWRLDVAYDLGTGYLDELRAAAQAARPDAWIVGEIWSYPESWTPALDGVMNFHARHLLLAFARDEIGGAHFGRLLERMVDDAGIEATLRSWLILDNHDTRRLATLLPDAGRRRIAQVLQCTLPGAPCIYYGVELGLAGGDDPANRGPMRWDLLESGDAEATAAHAALRDLLALRASSPALRIGDFRLLDSESLLAFQRSTDRRDETTIVVANPTGRTVHEMLAVRDSFQMATAAFVDRLAGEARFLPESGTLEVDVPPRTVYVLQPEAEEGAGYSAFKRMT